MGSLKRFSDTCNLSSKSVGCLECWTQFLIVFKDKLRNKKKLFWCFPFHLHVFDYSRLLVILHGFWLLGGGLLLF